MENSQFVILLLVLSAIGAYFFFKGKKKSFNTPLEDLKVGTKLSIKKFGDRKEEFTLEVKSKNRHEAEDGDLFWYEYNCISDRGEEFWLQIESIDPYEINGGNRTLNINELGVAVDDLLKIKEGELAFHYLGQAYYMDSGGSARCYINEGEQSYLYAFIEFYDSTDTKYISVEVVEGENPKVYLSFEIETNQINLL